MCALMRGGGVVSYPCPCEAWRFSLAAPRMPDGATEAASRPEGRLAVAYLAAVTSGFHAKLMLEAAI
jgi:hypothetical protein